MEIFPGLWLIDLAVYLPAWETLVIADLHLGWEEALRRSGVLIPRQHLQLIERRLERLLARLDRPPRRLIINGDLKHRFAPLSWNERDEVHRLLEFLDGRFGEVILLQGNHDRNIGYLAERVPGLKLEDSLREGRLLLLHGDRLPRRTELVGAELILIGHEHPAVGLRNAAGRLEVYKAFLWGEYHEKKLLVQPSFNPLIQGSDLAHERAISPLISEERLKGFDVYPVSDEGEIYPLGPLGPLLQQ